MDADIAPSTPQHNLEAMASGVTRIYFHPPGGQYGAVIRTPISVRLGRPIRDRESLRIPKPSLPDAVPAEPKPEIRRVSLLVGLFFSFQRASVYAHELDDVFKHSHSENDAFKVCTRKEAAEYGDLEKRWKAFVEDKVAEWSWYTRAQIGFFAFLFVVLQISSQNSIPIVSASLPYLTVVAAAFGLFYSQLLLSHLDNATARTLHFAVHFQESRVRYRRFLSLEAKFAVAFWAFVWTVPWVVLTFMYGYYQTTAGEFDWNSNALGVAAQVLMYSTFAIAIALLCSAHMDLKRCEVAAKRCSDGVDAQCDLVASRPGGGDPGEGSDVDSDWETARSGSEEATPTVPAIGPPPAVYSVAGRMATPTPSS